MNKLITGVLAALALTTAPVAQAAAPVRVAAPVEGANEMGGEYGAAPWILAALIVGGIIFAILSQEDDDDSDSP